MLGALAEALARRPCLPGVGVGRADVQAAFVLATPMVADAPAPGGLLSALSDEPRVLGGAWLTMLPALFFGTVSVLGPLRLDELGAGAAAIGTVWLIAAGLEAIVSPVAGHFSDRRGRVAPMLAGLVGGAVTFALLPWPETKLVLALLIIAGTPAIGMLWAPAMAMLSDGAERVGLEQGLAFGLMNLTWATGQSLGNLGGARIGEAAGDEVAYLLLSALCVVCFLILRTVSIRRPATV